MTNTKDWRAGRLGMLLERVNHASYVQQKINLMYNHAHFTDEQN
jgi:hypothetical protein